MKKTNVMNFVKVLIFNILETVVIFLLGKVFNVNMNIRIMFMATFFLTRMIIGKPKHYNKAYRCALWSCLVFLSLYSLSTLDLIATIILTIFTAFISTGKADINDMYMWKGRNTNYADIDEYIKFNELEDKLLEFERKLKQQDNLLYLLYKYRFKEGNTFSEINEKTGLENPRISEKLDKIAFSLRIYCGI